MRGECVVTIKNKGNFEKTEKFLRKAQKLSYKSLFDKYGRQGVQALSVATPVRTGLTASSWGYEVHRSASTVKIIWTNSNVVSGVPVAVLIQLGHGTGTGGYVTGIDYINPALRPVFDSIAEDAWKEVTK